MQQKIQEVFHTHRGRYGRPRSTKALQRQGVRVNRKRVMRLMHQAHLYAKNRPRRVKTTDSSHSQLCSPNLVDQNFTVSQHDKLWLSDLTYIPTNEGWLYLATVLDMYSRRIVGWAVSESLQHQIVLRALPKALTSRKPEKGLIFHSDQGRQYVAKPVRQLLETYHVRQSMSRRGNCYDNSPMESFFASLKKELIHNVCFQTRRQAHRELFKYIEIFYNRHRLHSALNYTSPVDFELLHHP